MANKHLVFPLKRSPDGQLLTAAEDSYEDYQAQVAVLSLTQRGERPLVPDLGVDGFIGAHTPSHGELQAECDRWIGDGRVSVEVSPVVDGTVFQHAKISVQP